MRRYSRVHACLLAAVTLLAAACTGDGEPAPSATAATTTTVSASSAPVTTTTFGTTTTTTRPPTTTTQPEPVPLVILVDEPVADVLGPPAAAFEAERGIPVEIRTASMDEIRQTVLAGGTDIALFSSEHTWTGDLAEGGAVVPIDLGVRSDDWLEVGPAAFRHGASVYGVPLLAEGVALYRNSDLVPDPPGSFEELAEICDDLADRIETCLGHPDPEDGLRHHPFVGSGNAYLFGDDGAGGYDVGDIGLATVDAIADLTVLDGLVEGGYADPEAAYEDMVIGFAEGRSAFLIGGTEVLEVLRGAAAPFSAGPLPSIAGERAVPLVRVLGFSVAAGTATDLRAAALVFLFDYVSTPAVAAAAAEIGGGLPVLIAAAESLSDAAAAQGVLTSIAGGRPIPDVPETGAALEAIGEAVRRIYEQSAEPEEALGEAVDRLRASLAG